METAADMDMANADITASRTGCSVNRDYVSGKLLWKKGLLSDIMKFQVLVLARQGIVRTFFSRLDTLKTIIHFERNVSVIASGSKIPDRNECGEATKALSRT